MKTVIKKLVMNNVFTKHKKPSKNTLLMIISFLGGTIFGGVIMLILLILVGLASYR
jgi:hypothetical protein